MKLEMFIYRAMNKETKLYKVGFVMAETKEKALEVVKSSFSNHYIVIYSKEMLCNLFVIYEPQCIDFSELCDGGYHTEKEMKLQDRLNEIQPLINELSKFRGIVF